MLSFDPHQAARIPRVVEKHYSPVEASALLGFAPGFWRDQAKAGELTLVDSASQAVIAEPMEISGELRIPASCLNAFLLRRPFRYDPGIKARNQAELRRKLKV